MQKMSKSAKITMFALIAGGILLTEASAGTPISATSSPTSKKKKQRTSVCSNGSNLASVGSASSLRYSLDKVINAIAKVESGGVATIMGDGGRAVGLLQIHREVVDDVNRKFGTKFSWPEDCLNAAKSRRICQFYLRIYCPQGASAERLARCWNGGPTGHKKAATVDYWKRVKKVLASGSGKND